MKKPTGVIIAAVLLVLLAIVGTLSTIAVAWVGVIMPHPATNGPQPQIVAVILFAFFALPTIFTWCVGLGLFRGKNWARIGGVVLGCLIALSSAFFALTTVAMMMIMMNITITMQIVIQTIALGQVNRFIAFIK